MDLPESIMELLQKNGGFPAPSTVDPVAHAQMLVDAQNREPGNLKGFDCPECLNRGYIFRANDRGQYFARECGCMVRRRNAKRLEKSGLSDMVQRYTFEAWEVRERWQQQAKDLALQYTEEQKGWFLAAGNPGSGKTHLCTAICRELLHRGYNTQYMLWRDVAVEAKSVVNCEEDYQRIVGPLKTLRVLFIDDLFKSGKEIRDGSWVPKMPTVGDVNLAFEILNSRYNDSKKITIISTEWDIYGLLDIDEAIGSRIYERSKGYYLDFSDKPNWRLQ